MSAIEWNKKEDLLQDQALRHLKQYTTLFAAFATTSKSEIVLLNKIQEYCYENMNFLKTFNKIVLLLYKSKLYYCTGVLTCFGDLPGDYSCDLTIFFFKFFISISGLIVNCRVEVCKKIKTFAILEAILGLKHSETAKNQTKKPEIEMKN